MGFIFVAIIASTEYHYQTVCCLIILVTLYMDKLITPPYRLYIANKV